MRHAFSSHLAICLLICDALLLSSASTLAAQSIAPENFSVLYSFKGDPDGSAPMGSLVRRAHGMLYGTTSTGGSLDEGTIFKLDSLGREKVIHSFGGQDDGFVPLAGLTPDSDNKLYGTTSGGGVSVFWGTVFQLDKNDGYTITLSFTASDMDGGYPAAHMVHDPIGSLFGGTDVGGNKNCPSNGCGVVFRTDKYGNGGVMHYFDGWDGWAVNDLLIDAGENLYGTTKFGGSPGSVSCCGTIFMIDPNRNHTVLYRFTGGTDASAPYGGLARDPAGNFYGTTSAGGAYGSGVLYRLSTIGELTVLHDFSGGLDGANPHGTLSWGNDGQLYGTTVNGGPYGYGVIFRFGKTGKLTVLHTFTGVDGAHPYAQLHLAADGAFYGTASQGGVYGGACGDTGCGTVFRYRP